MSTTTEADEFTIRHCIAWCESVGIDLFYVPEMVAEIMEDGPESTLSWPTIARVIGAEGLGAWAEFARWASLMVLGCPSVWRHERL